MYFSNEIKKALKITLEKLNLGNFEDIKLEMPKLEIYGEFSTPIALSLAKKLQKSPFELAKKIKNLLPKINFVEKVEIIKPGFINFHFKKDIFVEMVLEKVLNGKYKDELPGNQKTKVIIEHTSVNPNKAMHIGHIRNAILGDCLVRLYKKLGFKVEVHNYIDDTGVQVADLIVGLTSLDIKQPKNQDFDLFCWDLYTKINKEYETNPKLLEKRVEIIQKIEKGNNEIARQSQETVNKILQCQLRLLAKFNIFYDLLVFESDIIKFGFWEEAFEKLKKSPNFIYQTEGKYKNCWILKYEDEKFQDKVFVRSDNTKVYTAKDTAYHLWKFGLLNKDFLYKKWQDKLAGESLWKTDFGGEKRDDFGKGDAVINLIDNRQTYPQEMVKYALKSLGFKNEFENYHHLAYGVVNISSQTAEELGIDTCENRDSYAMAGRKGIGVKVKDLLDFLISKIKSEMNKNKISDEDILQIAVSAIKHYMLKQYPLNEIVFDYKQALQLTGNTGPYLQYAYTRVSKILQKAGDFPLTFQKTEKVNNSEFQLIKLINLWNFIQRETLETKSISNIADYAYNLSSAFHSFYENSHVLKSPADIKNFRLTLITAYQKIIQEVLNIMGIKTLEKM